MEELILEQVKTLNIIQLIAIAGMFWFFYNRINLNFEKVDLKFEKIELRLEKIEIQVNNLDKRLYAVECMIHMKDGCVIKASNDLRKAE